MNYSVFSFFWGRGQGKFIHELSSPQAWDIISPGGALPPPPKPVLRKRKEMPFFEKKKGVGSECETKFRYPHMYSNINAIGSRFEDLYVVNGKRGHVEFDYNTCCVILRYI